MNIKIEKIKKCKLCYFRGIGPYGPNNKKIMEKLKSWSKEKNLFNDSSVIYGIAQDDPAITPPEKCRYDACLVVKSNYYFDSSISCEELSGGTYAVFTVEHTSDAVTKAWSNIFTTLQNKGHTIDSKPILERYKVSLVNKGYCELCIPIK